MKRSGAFTETVGQASILIVGMDNALSRTRALLLKQWRPVVVDPEVATDAIAAHRWDMLIICQTVNEDVANNLALKMTTLHPGAEVVAINALEQTRSFQSIQFTVNLANPSWLSNAVEGIFSPA